MFNENSLNVLYDWIVRSSAPRYTHIDGSTLSASVNIEGFKRCAIKYNSYELSTNRFEEILESANIYLR